MCYYYNKHQQLYIFNLIHYYGYLFIKQSPFNITMKKIGTYYILNHQPKIIQFTYFLIFIFIFTHLPNIFTHTKFKFKKINKFIKYIPKNY